MDILRKLGDAMTGYSHVHGIPTHDELLIEAASEIQRLRAEVAMLRQGTAYRIEAGQKRAALSELARYFTSGNGIPVERATILAKDFWRITGLTPND